MPKTTKESRGRVLDRFQAAVSALRKSARRGRDDRIAESDKPEALAILREGPDQAVLRGIFHTAGWELAIADSVSSAFTAQERHPVPIILYDQKFPGCEWHKAVSALASLPGQPWVILLSSRCDQNLWDELTMIGGSDVLRAPLNAQAVIQAVKSGWLLWRHLRQLKRATGSRP